MDPSLFIGNVPESRPADPVWLLAEQDQNPLDNLSGTLDDEAEDALDAQPQPAHCHHDVNNPAPSPDCTDCNMCALAVDLENAIAGIDGWLQSPSQNFQNLLDGLWSWYTNPGSESPVPSDQNSSTPSSPSPAEPAAPVATSLPPGTSVPLPIGESLILQVGEGDGIKVTLTRETTPDGVAGVRASSDDPLYNGFIPHGDNRVIGPVGNRLGITVSDADEISIYFPNYSPNETPPPVSYIRPPSPSNTSPAQPAVNASSAGGNSGPLPCISSQS